MSETNDNTNKELLLLIAASNSAILAALSTLVDKSLQDSLARLGETLQENLEKHHEKA